MRIYLRRPKSGPPIDELETARFVLRPLGTWETLRDPGAWRTNARILDSYFHVSSPLNLVRWAKSGPIPDGVRRFTFAIIPKGTDDVIGLHAVTRNGYRSLRNSVGINNEAWLGKDVAVEVRARLMNHFYRHGFERFTGTVDARNFPSIFIYRKLGYDHVGTQHRERMVRGQLLDFLMFEMFKDKWMTGPYAEPDL